MNKLFSLLALCLFSFCFSSCKKEIVTEYPFEIQVLFEDGTPAQNVFVEAKADVPNSIPDFEGVTDVEGKVHFEYNNKAVLKVEAKRGNPLSWIGCGFVRLEAGVEVKKVIIIQPYDASVGGC
jgi:hypothetical protein